MRPIVSFAALLVPLSLACAPAASPPAAAPPPAHGAEAAPKPDIDGPAARKLVSEGALLVDVRTPDEYAKKHIDGAINVPVDEVASHDFGAKDKPIVVYCGSGRRAARAAETLRGHGYSNVQSLGGMSRWGDEASK